MQTVRQSTRSPRQRRGILSMELVLTLPVLAVLLFGIVEFACLFFSYGSVVEASRAGARVAALRGAEDGDVRDEVHRSLGPRLSDVAEVDYARAERSGEDTACAVRVPMSACAPNLLWPIGFDLEGEYIECATRMTTE